MAVIPVEDFEEHPAQPSSTWSSHVEQEEEDKCEEWGTNPVPISNND